MARAKRTDRAAARRRHRAQQAIDPDRIEDEDLGEVAHGEARSGAIGRPAQRRSSSGPTEPARPQGSGIGYAFRNAFRPARVREDLAHIGENLSQRSLWLTCLVSIAVAVAYVAFQGREIASGLLFQYFVYPPPVGAIFIAGFFARRASYLAGAITGLVSGVAFSVVVAAAAGGFGTPLLPTGGPSASPSAAVSPSTAPSPSAVASPSAPASAAPSASAGPSVSSAPASPAPSPVPSGSGTGVDEPAAFDTWSAVSYALTVSPVSGIIFGSAAAWYRRFLNLANPNRAQRRPPPQRGKPSRR